MMRTAHCGACIGSRSLKCPYIVFSLFGFMINIQDFNVVHKIL